jgi:alpha-L-fucosidase
MRNVLLIGRAILLSTVIHSATDRATAGEDRSGWERMIAPADPLLVNSVPSPRQLIYQTNQYGAFLHYGDPFSWPARLAINPKTGKPYLDEIVALARTKQPNMVIWHGSRPDIHFLRTEDGTAPYPLWNVLRKGEGAAFDVPWAEGWIVPETYNCHSTFAWVPTKPEKLLEQYYKSVGRGANFLQALVPDKRGQIDDAQVKAMAEFGAEVRRRFGHPIARTDSRKGWLEPGILQLDLGGTKKITHVVLEEEIAKGQHVLKYAIDAWADGKWKTIAQGQSVGRKRIERFEPAITAEKIRFRVVQANAIPSISAMIVHDE